MSRPLFSSSWYRVANLTPRLRKHARIHRHRYRGRIWYVLEDSSSQKYHRFTPAAHTVIAMMTGERTVGQIWQSATELLGDDAPTQDEMIRLLGQLHAADVLQSDVSPDAAELLQRFERKESKELQSRLMSPFAIRIPLIDPERFLERFEPFVRPLFSWWGAWLWLAVVVPAIFLVGIHWSELTEGILDRIISPQNLFVIWLTFPVIKAIHEFGHGFAVKTLGGEVHDMGIMFLVFTPVPYVDASAASAFSGKWQRALVGAGGMIVEVFAAAVALYVWLAAEPGVARAVAYNVMLIGGVTTLAFNANPLLRFDGYYVLGDVLEIPNLRQRSNQYLGYLVERYAFGQLDAEAPNASASECAWFVGYAVSAFIYRIFVVAAILLFLLEKSLFLGMVLALVSSVGWFGLPLYRGLKFLLRNPRIRRTRGRAYAVVAGALVGVVALLAIVPMPYRTRAEGVVWLPDNAFVRARADGFVARIVAEPGSRVSTGDLLIECQDPELTARVQILEARLRGARTRYHEERGRDFAQAEVLLEEVLYAEQQLVRAQERRDELAIRSRAEGTFVIGRERDLPGRFVRKGELLGHVLDVRSLEARAVVSEDDVDLVRERLLSVEVRLADDLDSVYTTSLVRIVPSASQVLPSQALGSEGGGNFATDPRDEGGFRSIEKLFEIELRLPPTVQFWRTGGRVYVRFDHGTETLVAQWSRSLRQLFLSRLDV